MRGFIRALLMKKQKANMIIDQNKIKPEGARVLIEPFTMEDETENGMVLSNTQSSGAPVMGKVIACGNKSGYEIGETVFFAKYSADAIEVDSVEGKSKFYIVAVEEILARYENDKPEKVEKYPAIVEKKEVEKILSKTKK